MPDRVIRVVIADDAELVRRALRFLIEEAPDIEVVAEAADGEAAVEAVRREAPHAVVMDVTMPRMNGIEATRKIVGQSRTKVIGLSLHDSPQVCSACSRRVPPSTSRRRWAACCST